MAPEPLHDANFLLHCAKHYTNPGCYDTQEFLDDVKRFKYLKRLFRSYLDTGELKTRLILNHVTIVYNLFGDEASRLLFFRLWEYRTLLRPFIDVLERMPPVINTIGIEARSYAAEDILADIKVTVALTEI